MSGLATRRFCFEAFLPTDKKERARILEELKTETRTIIMYEAPHRLTKTLAELSEVFGESRRLTICRELTKRYEEARPTTFAEALEYYEENEPKGEFVLVIEGVSHKELLEEARQDWLSMPIEEHMAKYEAEGMSNKDAMKQVAKDRGVSKRDIYQYMLTVQS